MTVSLEVPIRDKWEAKIASMRLNERLQTLEEIKRQELATQEEINALTDKLNMHKRDAEYVARCIARDLPSTVIDVVKGS